jgi:hypothetical protein
MKLRTLCAAITMLFACPITRTGLDEPKETLNQAQQILNSQEECLTNFAALPETGNSSNSSQMYCETSCSMDEAKAWAKLLIFIKEMREQEITRTKLSWPHPATLDLRPTGHTKASLQKAVYEPLERERLASECPSSTSERAYKSESANCLFEFLKKPKEIGTDE